MLHLCFIMSLKLDVLCFRIKCETRVGILLLIKQIEENGFLSPAGVPVLSPAMSLQPEVHYSLEVDGIVGR